LFQLENFGAALGCLRYLKWICLLNLGCLTREIWDCTVCQAPWTWDLLGRGVGWFWNWWIKYASFYSPKFQLTQVGMEMHLFGHPGSCFYKNVAATIPNQFQLTRLTGIATLLMNPCFHCSGSTCTTILSTRRGKSARRYWAPICTTFFQVGHGTDPCTEWFWHRGH